MLDYLKDYVAAGIENPVQAEKNNRQNIVFDLSGRRIATPNLPKGIYINNGKKFVVK